MRGRILSFRDRNIDADAFFGWETGLSRSIDDTESAINSYGKKFYLTKENPEQRVYGTGVFEDDGHYGTLFVNIKRVTSIPTIGLIAKSEDPLDEERRKEIVLDFLRSAGIITLKGFGNSEKMLEAYLTNLWERLGLDEMELEENFRNNMEQVTLSEAFAYLKRHDKI
jgi:hypothetical protein